MTGPAAVTEKPKARIAWPVFMQAGCIILALLTLAFYPPAKGNMLIVPVTESGKRDMFRIATHNGAFLMGRGPFDNSYVINGSRAELAPALLKNGILVMSATPAGCGSFASGDIVRKI